MAPEFLPIETMLRVTSGQAMTSNAPTMSDGMKSAALRRMNQRYASCCGFRGSPSSPVTTVDGQTVLMERKMVGGPRMTYDAIFARPPTSTKKLLSMRF